MKTWKLVSGILSIIFSVFVFIQSQAMGLYNALADSNDLGGGAGLIVAVMLLAGGITSIAVRKAGKGGGIAVFILFGLGALAALSTKDSIYADLPIWGGWCAICAALALISAIAGGRKKQKPQQGVGA